MRPLLLSCTLLLLLGTPSLAQEEPGYVPRPLSLWASGGLGPSGFNFTHGSSWGISTIVGGAVRYNFVTLKYKWTTQRQLRVRAGGFAESLSMQEVLIGYAFRLSPNTNSRTRLGVYSGVGQLSHRHPGPMQHTMSWIISGDPVTTTATTVPFEFELDHHFSPHLGGSILAFVSFSSLQPAFGLTLSVRAGLL